MTSTNWTPQTLTGTYFGMVSGIFYNESGRTYNASEWATTNGRRYYNGLTLGQVNFLVPSSTDWSSS